MRSFHPLHLAAAVAIALSGSAIAQTTTSGVAVRVAPAANTTSNGTTTAAPATTTGGCVGTGGSSCTATTSASPATTNSGVVTTTSPTPGVRGESGASQMTLSETLGGQAAGGSGSAMGSNQTTVDPATTRPGSFEPGGAFGPPGSTTTTTTIPATLPGTTGALVLPATGVDGVPQSATQQTVVIQQPQSQTRVATPIFDEVAREGRAKERQRRAQGNEPRIYGIAPRTDNDLTHQMPDDPIIRY